MGGVGSAIVAGGGPLGGGSRGGGAALDGGGGVSGGGGGGLPPALSAGGGGAMRAGFGDSRSRVFGGDPLGGGGVGAGLLDSGGVLSLCTEEVLVDLGGAGFGEGGAGSGSATPMFMARVRALSRMLEAEDGGVEGGECVSSVPLLTPLTCGMGCGSVGTGMGPGGT